MFKADDDNLISFGESNSGGDGSSTNNFVLKSQNVFLSGSNVNILSDKFYLGGVDAYVSGSNGNIEVSSSNFHLTRDGNITASNANLSGKVTATSGDIGGWSIEDGSLTSGTGPNSVTISADDQLIVMGSTGGIEGTINVQNHNGNSGIVIQGSTGAAVNSTINIGS